MERTKCSEDAKLWRTLLAASPHEAGCLELDFWEYFRSQGDRTINIHCTLHPADSPESLS
jgi:hypothetical protein